MKTIKINEINMKTVVFSIVLSLLLVSKNNSFGQTQTQSSDAEEPVGFTSIGLRMGSCSSDKMYYKTTTPIQYYKDRFGYWGTIFTVDRYSKNGYLNFDFSGLTDLIILGSYQVIADKTLTTGKLKNFEKNISNPDARNLGGIYTDVFSMKLGVGGKVNEKLYWKIGGHYRYGLQQSVLDEIYNSDDLSFYQNRVGYNHAYGPSVHICYQSVFGNISYIWRNTFMYNLLLGADDDKGKGFKFESVMHTNKLIFAGLYFENSVLNNPETKWVNFGITTGLYIRNDKNRNM